MKINLLVLASLISFYCRAQFPDITVVKIGGDSVQVKFRRVTSDFIATSGGRFLRSEINEIIFLKKSGLWLGDLKKMIDNNYKFSFMDTPNGNMDRNFILESGSLLWQRVYHGVDSKNEILDGLKKNQIFKVTDTNDSLTNVDVANWTLDINKYRTSSGYPAIYKNAKWNCHATIEIKNDRYRVTVSNIGYSGMGVGVNLGFGVSTSQEISGTWESAVLNKGRDEIKDQLAYDYYELIDNALSDIFNLKTKVTEKKTW